MNALGIFITALEKRLNTNGKIRGVLVPMLQVNTASFKAYKTYKQDLWLIDGSNKQLIATSVVSGRAVTDTEKEELLEKSWLEVIDKTLEHYGL